MAEASSPSALEVITELLGLRPRAEVAGPSPGSLLGLVAGGGSPKFLVPLGWSPAAVASCLAYQGLREPRTRANRLVVGTALRAGLGRRIVISEELVADVGDGSLVAHLGGLLGRDELAVAIGIGRMHALWRPTLQLFEPDGTPLAYVKVGRNPTVASLVSTEAAALRLWADKPDPRLVVPRIIAESTWRDHPILVVAPMPGDVRRLPPGPVGAWGVRTLDDPLPDAPLSDATWWTGRRVTFADTRAVDELLQRVEDRHRGRELSWARWHGDWVPWNVARSHAGLVAWDWEYSEPAAPVGLDETHQAFQLAHVAAGRPVAEALAAARRAAPSAAVADCHVAMLVTRFADVARTSGAQLPGHDELLAAARSALG